MSELIGAVKHHAIEWDSLDDKEAETPINESRLGTI